MKQMISTEPSLQQRIQLLREATYDGPVQARNPRQKVSDEELVALFGTIKGKWVRVDDLNEAFQNLVSVNVSNPKRPPVNFEGSAATDTPAGRFLPPGVIGLALLLRGVLR